MVTNSFGLIPDKYDSGVFYNQTDRIQLEQFLMISPCTHGVKDVAMPGFVLSCFSKKERFVFPEISLYHHFGEGGMAQC